MNIAQLTAMSAPKREQHAGQALSICLDVLNKSPKDLADHLGVSRQHLHKMKDTKKINQDRLEEIAKWFEMDVDEFVDLPNHVISFSLETYFRQSISYLSKKGITQSEADDLANGMVKVLSLVRAIEER